MVDQLRSTIEETLDKRLDGAKFQKCATELLGEIYPSLVLTSGSYDYGRDGIIAHLNGQNHILTCTTSDRVLENLRKSLKSFRRSGGRPGLVTVATSARITARKRNHLEREAEELGFLLVQVYDHSWFSRQLYQNASWCEELLGVSGQPAALSTFPRTRRPHIHTPLVGRESELEELREARGDLILYGEPGVGKTFLLQVLVEEGWGLFLVDSNKKALADAVRSERPARIIVDDAHFASDLVEDLKHLRIEIGANFGIVATSWPDWTPDISGALIGAEQLNLPRLTRDQILEVVRHCGIPGPRELQKHLVDQARGRPGLAATLSLACLTGGIEAVWRGELLLKDVFGGLGMHGNDETQGVYAVLALGGDAGVDINDTARCLETSSASVLACVRGAASAGTLEQARGPNTNALVVQPEVLRFAIVSEYFFNPKVRLPLTPILERLPEPSQAVIPLIASAHRGHPVDRSLLLEMLKVSPTELGVTGFASLGSAETEIAVSEFPHLKCQIAKTSLRVAPSVSLRSLLEAAVVDERPRNMVSDHPLRIIEDYAHSLSNRVSNRRHVLEAVREWLDDGGVPNVALEALAAVVDPQTEASWTDPGAGNQVTISRGMVPPDEITELEQLWEGVLELVAKLNFTRFGPILEAWESWVWPSRLLVGSASLPDHAYERARKVARKVAMRIREAFGDRPGIIARLKQTSFKAELRIRFDLLADFETLFPSRDQPKGEFAVEKHHEMERRQHAKARRLGKRLCDESPDVVIERLIRFEHEADIGGLNRYPHTTPTVFDEIASRVEDPGTWLTAAEGMVDRQFAMYFRPFCASVLTRHDTGWEQLVSRLLASSNLNYVMALSCLKSDVPEVLLEVAVSCCTEMSELGLTYEARFFTRKAKLLLLGGRDVRVRRAVIEGQVMEGLEELSGEERKALLAAAVNVAADETWIPLLLSRHPNALGEWVLNWAARARDEPSSYESVPPGMLVKLGDLPLKERRELLNRFPGDILSLTSGEVIDALVGNDIETAEIVFSRPELEEHRSATIGDKMDEAWVERAEVALRHGFAPEDIMISAANPSSRMITWFGEESARWRLFVEKCQNLLEGPSETHKLLGDCGLKLFEEQQKKAKQKEHQEAVFGDAR